MGFGLDDLNPVKAAKKVAKKVKKLAGDILDPIEDIGEGLYKSVVKPSLGIGKSLLEGEVQGAARKAFRPIGKGIDATLAEAGRFLGKAGLLPSTTLEIPEAEESLAIPTIDEEAVARARRRAAAQAARSGGRSSTILTSGGGVLG